MRVSAFFFSLCLFGTATLRTAAQSSALAVAPAPPIAKKITLAGIHNAGKVSERLYRGAQPNLQNLSELKQLGITTIVDLRAESPQTAEQERQRAKSLGIRFVRIPIGGFSNPTPTQLAEFLRIVQETPAQTVFVHCEFGHDRTGVMIASYRIAMEHWTPEQALSEMSAFGFSYFWHPGMVTFVRNLPQVLRSDERFRKAS